jgi:hypothetical protein
MRVADLSARFQPTWQQVWEARRGGADDTSRSTGLRREAASGFARVRGAGREVTRGCCARWLRGDLAATPQEAWRGVRQAPAAYDLLLTTAMRG